MTITITHLNKRELECADQLLYLCEKMWRLGPVGRENVYARWRQLYMMLDTDIERFERNLQRLNDKSGRDRRRG